MCAFALYVVMCYSVCDVVCIGYELCVFESVFESRYLCYSSPHRNGHNLYNYLCIQSRRAIFSYRASLDTKIPICVKHFTNTYYFMGVNMGVNILIR